MKPRWYHWLISVTICFFLIGLCIVGIANFKLRGPSLSSLNYEVKAVLVVNFEYLNDGDIAGAQATEYLKGKIEKIILKPNKHGGRAEIKTSAGWYFLDAGLLSLEGNGDCTLWLEYSGNTKPLKQVIIEVPRFHILGVSVGRVSKNILSFSSDIASVKMTGVYYKKDGCCTQCEVAVGSGIREEEINYRSRLTERRSVFTPSVQKYQAIKVTLK